jgi:hypothetical protein
VGSEKYVELNSLFVRLILPFTVKIESFAKSLFFLEAGKNKAHLYS